MKLAHMVKVARAAMLFVDLVQHTDAQAIEVEHFAVQLYDEEREAFEALERAITQARTPLRPLSKELHDALVGWRLGIRLPKAAE